jgi:hypothetical protein
VAGTSLAAKQVGYWFGTLLRQAVEDAGLQLRFERAPLPAAPRSLQNQQRF